MRHLKLIPDDTKIPFTRWRYVAVGLSLAVMILAVVLLFTRGLNFGIDFEGGILVEIATEGPADIGQIRSELGTLGLGDVQIQQFGQPNDVLIRMQSPKGEDADKASQAVVQQIKGALGEGVEYRRVEVVGPQVSGELVQDGILAVVVSVGLMLVYIWFRFEWQFSLGSVVALVHDVMATLALFCLLRMEFDLQSIAALLTIVGYSMNDTVIVFDRVRENLRKYKKMDLGELIDLSVNQTLSRTVMTSGTTLLALLALFIFGGEVIRGFTFAMIFGIFIGTYSSIFIAGPVLLAVGVTRDASTGGLGGISKEKAPGKA